MAALGRRILPFAAAHRCTVALLVAVLSGQSGASPTPLPQAPGEADGTSPVAERSSEPARLDSGTFQPDLADSRLGPNAAPIELRQGEGGRDKRASHDVSGAPVAVQGADAVSVREVSKSTLGWLHDALPWMTTRESPDKAPAAAVSTDVPVLPVEAGPTASSVFVPHAAPAAKAVMATTSTESHGSSRATPLAGTTALDRAMDAGPEDGFHRLLRLGRGVMVHPLTWAVIVLLAAGHVVVSRFNRRR